MVKAIQSDPGRSEQPEFGLKVLFIPQDGWSLIEAIARGTNRRPEDVVSEALRDVWIKHGKPQ